MILLNCQRTIKLTMVNSCPNTSEDALRVLLILFVCYFVQLFRGHFGY